MPKQNTLQRHAFAAVRAIARIFKHSLVFGCFLMLVLGVYTYTRVLTHGFLPTAEAATSDTLNFQARLYDSSGNIVDDGTYNIEFKIYDSAAAGSSAQGTCVGGATDDCQWMETRTGGNQVTIKNGYFSVNLGSVTSLPTTLNWDQDLYLTMNIGGTGAPAYDGEMTPRLKLTSVPYAVQAKRAEQLRAVNGAFTSTLSLTAPTANRTLTAPNLSGTLALTSNNQTFTNTQTFSGTLSVTGTLSATGTANTIGDAVTDNLTIGAAIQGLNALYFDGATNDTNETILAVQDPTQDNTITLPNASGTICLSTGNCAGSGGNGDILQDGNSFTAPVTIGTNDAYALNLETSNTTRFSISSTGTFTFVGLDCTTFANGGALTTDASGNLSCSDDNGGAGAGGVTSLNTLTGGLTIQGTTGKVTVADNATDTITIDLDASVSLLGQSIQDGEVDDDLTISASGSVDDGALSANVSLFGSLVDLAELAGNSVNSSKIVDGSVTGTDIAGSTITGSNIATGTVTGGNIQNGTIEAVDLESTNTAGAGTDGYIVVYDNATGGFTYVAPGSVGGADVDSLNSLTGALTLQGTAGQITITDNGTNTITLALNANVSLLGQSIELAELSADSVNASKIVDASITGTDIAASTIANSNLVNSSLTVTAGAGLSGCGTISLGGSCTLTVGSGTGISASGTTVSLDYSATLATNSLGANQTSFASTGIIAEGSTADAFETLLAFTNPTADNTITFANASGTVITTGNLSSITATGALTSGSIASGFGAINNGASGITTTGALAGGNTTVTGTLNVTGTSTLAGVTAGAITTSGNFSQTGATTFSTGTGANTFNGASTFNSTAAFTTLGTANTDNVLCRNSSNQLASCNSTFATTTSLNNYVQLQGATPGTAQTGNINVTGTIIGGSFSGNGANLTNLNASALTTGTVPTGVVSGSYTGITGTGALNTGSITSGFGNINNGSSTLTTGAITTSGNFSQTGATTFSTGTGANTLNGTTTVSGSNPFNVGTGLTTLGGGLRLSTLNCTTFTNGGALTTDASGNVTCSNDDGGAAGAVDAAGTPLVNQVAYFSDADTIQGSANFTFNGSALSVTGSVTATSFAGDGSSLTALNATQLTSGTVPSARVSGSYTGITGVGTLAAGSITNTFGNIDIGSSTFTGNGSGLTTLNGTNISTGTVANARLVNSGALTVTAGTGLSGGGSVALGASTTLNLANTAVSAGTYGSATQVGQFTVDAQGRITNATNVAITGLDSCSTCVSLQGATPGTPQTGNINVSGTIIAGNFSGNGSALTNLNASNLASGTVADARLSSNVALLNGNQTFSGNNTFSAALTLTALGATNTDSVLCRNASNQVASCSSTFATTSSLSGYVQLQGTTPGTAQTGNLNLTGTGIFSTALSTPLVSGTNLTVQALSTGTLTLDTAGAGTVNIGTNAATLTLGAGAGAETINVGTAGGNDTVNILTGTGTNTLNVGNATTTSYFLGNVGIGANNPDARFTVVNPNVTSNQINLRSSRSAITTNNIIGGLAFTSDDTSLTAPGILTASIQAIATAAHTTTVLDTALVFNTTSGTTISEVVRITGNNRVGIGTTAPAAKLNVTDAQQTLTSGATGTAAISALTVLGGTGGDTDIVTTGTGGAGGAISLTGGTGGRAIAAATGNGGAGGALTLQGGTGGLGDTNNGGAGGAVTISGGTGGAGANLAGNGGAVTLQGGAAAASAGSAGGAATVSGRAGSATGSGGNGGALSLLAGSAGGDNTVNRTGGAITVTAGASRGASAGGAIAVTSGAGGQNLATGTVVGAASGGISLTVGTGGTAPNGDIQSTGGAAGTLTFAGGVGGAASVAGTGNNVGGAGSAFTWTAGTGGAANGATSGNNTGGAGGTVTLQAGTGGAATVGSGNLNGGNGGNLTLNAGSGGLGVTNGGNGGTVTIQGGTSVAAEGSNGGAVAINGRAGSTTGTGGNGGAITLVAGAAGGDNTVNRSGGAISLTAGASRGATQAGGAVSLTAGAAGQNTNTGTATGPVGGGMTFTTGAGGTSPNADVASTGGAAGAYTVNGGTGGAAGVAGTGNNTGGRGATFTFTAGTGGAANGATTGINTGGGGGDIVLQGGTGGAATAGGTLNGGNGGSLFLVGGAFGTNGTTNGNVNLAVTSGGTARGNVGIGLIDPDARLSVLATSTTTSQVSLRSSRAAIVSGNVIGGIDFMSNDTQIASPGGLAASIQAIATATHTGTVYTSDLVFNTTNGTTSAEAFRLTSGNNGILAGTLTVNGGTVTSGGNLNITAATTNTLTLDSAGAGTVTIGTNATTVNVAGGTGAETVNIAASNGNDTVNVLTGAGTNTLNIGTATTTSNFTGLTVFNSLGTANTDNVLCRNSSNQLASCSSTFATTTQLGNYVQLQGATPGTQQTGHINISGTIIAGSFSGNGSGLTNLNASNLASGTVPSGVVSGSYTGITGTGALNAGSITSGFGAINNGASGITTTGALAGGNTTVTGTLDVTGASTLSSLAVSSSVAGGFIASTFTNTNDSSGAFNEVQIISGNAGTNGGLRLGTTDESFGGWTGGSFIYSTAAGGRLAFGTENVERLTLTATGDVNIVSGALQTGGTTRLTSAGVLQNVTNADAATFFTGGTLPNARLVNSGALTVSAGTGLTGGGSVALGASTTLNLANTAVSAGTYGSATQVGQFTVDAQGRITNATNVAITGLDSCSTCVSLQGATPGTPQTGNINVSGTIIAGNFSGNGSALTNLNASNLASGTVPSARVSGSYTGITGVGALDAGSITSNFGNINIGASTFTNTGTASTGALTVTGAATVTGNVTSANGSAQAIQLRQDFGLANIEFGAGSSTNTGALKVYHFNDSLYLDGTAKYLNLARAAGTHTVDAGGNGVGDKLALYGTSNATRFGFGVQSSRTVAYVPSGSAFSVRQTAASGQGSSGTDAVTLFANGDLTATGTITGNLFTGSGANLTNLNASNLASGTVPSARISGSYTGLTGTGALTVGSIASGFGNINIGSNTFTGNGSGLTSLNGSNISSGTVADARLTANVTLQGNTFNGANQLVRLNGSAQLPAISGALLTNLDAGALATGTVSVARGGTGSGSFTSNGVLYGNGAGTIGVTAAGVNGECLAANTSSAPTWVSCSVAGGGATPGGSAGGDLSGTYPNPTVARINGTSLGSTTASAGNLLVGSGTQWITRALSGDATINSTGVLTLGTGAVTSAKIFDGTIANIDLSSGTFSNITGTGALGAGSITSGFGSINNGSSGITSTGTIVGSVIQATSRIEGIAADNATTPSFTWTGDTSTGMFRKASNAIGFTTAGTERLNISSTGNVGIGSATSPSDLLHIGSSTNSEHGLLIQNTNTGASGAARLTLKSSSNEYRWQVNNNNNPFIFGNLVLTDVTNSTARMILDTAGNFSLGGGNPEANVRLDMSNGGSSATPFVLIDNNRFYGGETSSGSNERILGIGSNDEVFIGALDGNAGTTRIRGGGNDGLYVNGSGLVGVYNLPSTGANNHLCYGAFGNLGTCTSLRSSKNSINNIGLGLETLRQLRPVEFNWNQGGSRDIGFIAEEVESINPLLAEYNGMTGRLSGVKYSQMSSLLTKSVQQLDTQVQSNTLKVNTATSVNTTQANQLNVVNTSISGINSALSTAQSEINAIKTQLTNGTLTQLNVSGPSTVSTLTVTNAATIKTLTVTGSSNFKGNITYEGKLVAKGTLPTVNKVGELQNILDAVVEISGNDSAGTFTVRTDASGTITSGEVLRVDFAKPFTGSAVPKVVVSAINQAGSRMPVFIERDINGFTVYFDEALSTNSEYSFDYVVIGSETATNN